MRAKIDNEVGPGTVRTWLTICRTTQATAPDPRPARATLYESGHRARLCILARMPSRLIHNRPCRELQSQPSSSRRSHRSAARAPPGRTDQKNFTSLLTGNSVEVVRRLACTRKIHMLERKIGLLVLVRSHLRLRLFFSLPRDLVRCPCHTSCCTGLRLVAVRFTLWHDQVVD